MSELGVPGLRWVRPIVQPGSPLGNIPCFTVVEMVLAEMSFSSDFHVIKEQLRQ